jgi:hypothetical protein
MQCSRERDPGSELDNPWPRLKKLIQRAIDAALELGWFDGNRVGEMCLGHLALDYRLERG